MDALLARQQSNATSIARFWENFNRTGKSKQTAAFVQGRIKLLDQYWNNCWETHQEMVALATPEDLKDRKYFSEQRFFDFEQEYCEVSARMHELLEKSAPPPPVNNGSASIVNESVSESYRLPTITLPRFSGNYSEWTSFRDLFNALIHDNKSLTDVQRLHYLKSNLCGEAEAMLKNVTIDAANYKSAFKTLSNRFENTRLIVNTQLRQLMALPAVNETALSVKNLLDGTIEVIQALKNLGRPVDTWDDLLIYITVQKLDIVSRKEWETLLGASKEPPVFKTLHDFLEKRICILEAVDVVNNRKTPVKQSREIRTHVVKAEGSYRCALCGKGHLLVYCRQFKRKSVIERRSFVLKAQLCFNCLKDGHVASQCPTKIRCYRCDSTHNTLLHLLETTSSSSTATNQALTSNVIQGQTCSQVLLATARVTAGGPWGSATLRVLIDQGSQATLVTENVAQALRLPRRKMLVRITGVGNSEAGESKGVVSVNLTSHVDPEFTITVDAFVVSKLTAVTPTFPVKSGNWLYLKNIILADPQYHEPGAIDMIVGADVYGILLREGILRGEPNQPVAVNTKFGWILSGPVGKNVVPSVNVNQVMIDNQTLANQLRNFWELEETVELSILSADEKHCEEIYTSTTVRDFDGRYVVRLPMKANVDLGESRKIAECQLIRLEKRLAAHPELYHQYSNFLNEYESLGHMKQIDAGERSASYYLPHHCIVKEQSTSTKLRVVFNASQVTTNGKSLNDQLFIGPKLQQDLWSIILRWRQHYIVFAADIEKMYRQIRVADDDTYFQRILWRRSPKDKIAEFRLTTVTYGTSCAPYLAIRTLLQLAQDEKVKYPFASIITCRDFYVDDILSGADTKTEALTLQHQLLHMMNAGGFTLKKWVSNCDELLEPLPVDFRECSLPLELNTVNDVKTLGVIWHPVKDVFCFKIKLITRKIVSKRTVLSDIASLYDPLGWLSPSIITAKIMLQRLWNLGIDWDAPLPNELKIEWQNYRQSLPQLATIEIERWIGYRTAQHNIQLHAFCDSSTKAYAAAIYIRIDDNCGNVHVSLLTSKSKVAPVKAVSIPRLELCGAVLLVRLLNNVRNVFDIPFQGVCAWTDSTIVLHWLGKEPRSWKTFVCNRVAEIQQSLDCSSWYYVKSAQNPADCATRGVAPDILGGCDLWWSGPLWLRRPSSSWPRNLGADEHIEIDDKDLEYATKVCVNVIIPSWDLLMNYSSLTHLLRITAWCNRFVFNCRTEAGNRRNGILMASEIDDAERYWIKHEQGRSFNSEIIGLRENEAVSGGKLSLLNPFIDGYGIVRVGGRLKNALLPYDEKHPTVLCKTSHLAKLIINNAHISTLHGGLDLTSQYVRQKYWILGGRNQIKGHLRKCITCFKQTARTSQQMMGDLPRPRIVPSRTFLHVGIDYAGPISVRAQKGRGHHSHKAWIALFVCFSTKAVHIELVHDYTTESFVAAFKRFVSRRGLCSDIYSDCGTNFVGAQVKLKADRVQFMKAHQENVGRFLAMHSINWHFNPPSAPHFGGLWEANIKSAKAHMKKVIGNVTLTSEEMLTVLAQIESAMNSRPIHPMSSDPNDFTALTPGHFLIGEPLMAVPEPNLLDANSNRLTRWKLVQQIQQHFWSRWTSSYLNILQQRSKWLKRRPDVVTGALVLLKDDRLPPNQWALGRIVEVHPGRDNLVRVVSVRCNNKVIQRPVVKLAVLPMGDETGSAWA